ncbi:MAG: hypothetical protein C0415_06140, partial [Thermodesulfovibrio sp.]|nr:hypothetical protein [Thermodesulfovibrio sp.]
MIKKLSTTKHKTSSARNFHRDDTLSCDWKPASKEKSQDNKSRIIRFKKDFKWSGVKTEKYKKKDRSWSDIVRKVLIGHSGETAKFHLRYFEIAPEGYSSLERHRHEHVVICIRGKGKILIDKKYYTIGYLDTVYVA